MKLRRPNIFGAIFALMLLMSQPLMATNYYITTSGNNGTGVAGNSGQPFQTIAYIFANYNLAAGDSIIISAGTYSENSITMGSDDEGFVIYGADSSTVIFDNNGGGQKFIGTGNDNNDSWTIEGITIREYDGVSGDGAVTLDHEVTNITFKSVYFAANNTASSGNGGAITFDHDDITFTISKCYFYDNHAESTGGALFFSNSDMTGTISDTKFEDNDADTHGGAFHNDGDRTDLTVNDCIFDNNYAAAGGAIEFYFLGTNLSIEFNRCHFYDNGKNNTAVTSSRGYAIESDADNSTITINSCLFYDNAGSQHGTIEQNSSTSTYNIHNCTFANNDNATTWTAGPVSDAGTMNIYNSILYGNSTEDVEDNGGTITMNRCVYGSEEDVTTITNCYNSDPNFIAPASDNYDFNSPSDAENNGLNANAPATDITGAARANPPDIGAYEQGNGPPCTPPSTQATGAGNSAKDSVGVTLTWTSPADGNNVLVVMRAGNSTVTDPSGRTAYTANTAFGSGSDLGSNSYVVYGSNGTSVSVTGLSYATTYYVEIFNYNTADNCYNTTSPLTYNFTTDSSYIFVNDASTTGDGYCSAAGSDITGTGTAAAPYLSLAKAFSEHNLDAGSVIKLDKGTYNTTAEDDINPDNNDNDFVIRGLDTSVTIDPATATKRAFIFSQNGSVTLKSFRITGTSKSDVGSAIYYDNNTNSTTSTLTLTDMVFYGNTASGVGNDGTIWVGDEGTATTSHLVVTNCHFRRNSVSGRGGAIHYEGGTSGTVTINRSYFHHNVSDNHGSAIHILEGTTSTITNCLFYENETGAMQDGTIYIQGSGTHTFWNCTVADNIAGDDGGITSNCSGTVNVYNCIIWDNYGKDLDEDNSGSFNVDYCVYNSGQTEGTITVTNSLTTDPQFFSTAGDNYDIKTSGSAYNAATETGAPSVDITNSARDVGDYDIGCYESGNGPCPAQHTWDGSTDDDWTDGDNWAEGSVPCGNAIIINDVANDPTISTKVTCTDFTMNGASILTWSTTDSIKVSGNVDLNGTATINHTSTGVFYLSGTTKAITADAGVTMTSLPLTIDGTISLSDDLTVDSVNVKTGKSMTVADTKTLSTQNGYVNVGTTTLTAGADLNVDRHFVNSGTFTLNTGDLYVARNFTNTSTFTVNTSTVHFDGGENTLITDADGISFNNLTVNKTATSDVVSCNSANDDVAVGGNLLISEGTYTNGSADLTITGLATIDDGQLIAGSGDGPVTFNGNLVLNNDAILDLQALSSAGDININGDVDINGTAGIQSTTSSARRIDFNKDGGNIYCEAAAAANSSSSTNFWWFTEDYTFNNDMSIGNLRTSGAATAAITVATGQTLTIGNVYNNANGTITLAGSANMIIASDAWLAHHTGATFTINSGYVDFNGSNLRFSGSGVGTFSCNSGTVRCSGNIPSTGGNTGTHNWGTGTLEMDGNDNKSISAYTGETYYNFVMNKGATNDTITFSSDISVGSNYTNTQGTLRSTGTTNTYAVTGTSTITAGTLSHDDNGVYSLANVVMNGGLIITEGSTDEANDYITISGNLDLNGTATITQSGEADIKVTGSSKTIDVEATVTTSTVELEVTTGASYTLNDDATLEDLTTVGTGDFAVQTGETLTLTDDLINSSTGTFSLEGTSALTIAGDFTNNNGTFEENTSTVTFNGTENSALVNTGGSETFYNFIMNKTAIDDTVATDDNITVSEDYTSTQGTYHINGGTLDIGDVTTINNGGIWLESGSLIADNDQFYINDGLLHTDAGTVDIDAGGSTYDFNMAGGIVQADGGTWTIEDDTKISGGLFQVNGATITTEGASGALDLSAGEFEINSGTFNIGVGLVGSIETTGGTFDMNGGTVNSNTEYYQSSGTFDISGGTLNLGVAQNAQWELTNGTYNLTGGTIVILDGAGALNDAIEVGSSVTMGTVSGGKFLFQATNQTTYIDLDGNYEIYDLEIDNTNQGTGFKNDAIIAGTVTITSGDIDNSIVPNDVTIKGNFYNNSADGTAGFNPGTGKFTFQGSSAQTIGGTKVSTFYDLKVNNSNDVTIDTTITVTSDLELTDGNIKSSWSDMLILDNSADNNDDDFITYSSSAYINGPVRVVGFAAQDAAYTDTLEIPLGDGTNYAPIRIIPNSTNSTTWEVRYADTSAAAISSNKCSSDFTTISPWDRFHVRRLSGTADAKLRFHWNANSNVTNQSEMNDLIVLLFDKTANCWAPLSVDTTNYRRTWANKWIETEFDVTSDSIFAFGSILGYQLLDPACQTVLTWDGSTDDSWNDASNWDLNTVPCGNDVIIPDVATDPILDVNGSCGNLTIQTGGFLTLAGAFSLSINGNLDINGTGRIDHSGTNVMTMNGETKTIDVESTADISNLELTIAGPISNTSDLDMEDLNVTTAGRLTMAASTTIDLTDDVDNDGVITFGGTADSLLVGDALDNDGTITLTTGSVLDVDGAIDNASGKTLNLTNGKMHTAGDFTNAGTFTVTGSTVEFDGTNTTTIEDADGIDFNVVIINKTDLADELQFDDSVRVTSTLTLTQGTVKSDGATNSFTVDGATTMAAGKFDHNDNGVYRFEDITMNGSSNITTAGSDANDFIEIGGNIDLNGTATIAQSGSVDIRLIGANKTITAEAGVTTSTANFDIRTTADYDLSDDLSLNDLTLTDAGDFAVATTKTLTLSDDLTLTTSNGIFTLTGTAAAIIAGDWSNAGGTFNENNSTVTFNGTANSALANSGGAETFYNLTTNKTATNDTVATDDNIIVSNVYTNTEGTYHINAGTLDIASTLNIDGGELWLPSGTLRADDATVDMDGGVLDVDAGTVDFDNDASGNFDFDISGGKVEIAGGAVTVGDDILLSGGEVEIDGGTLTINSEEATTNEGFINTGGTLDINGGTVASANEYVQSSGTLEMGAGTFNIGTSADGLFSITGGTYNLTAGTIDVQNHNASANEINIATGATVGTVSGGLIKLSAQGGASEINVHTDKKVYNLEVDVDGQISTIQDDLDIDNNITITSGQLVAGSTAMNVGGTWTNNSGDGTTGFSAGTGSVTMDGGSAQTITGTKMTTFCDLTLNNANGVTIDTTTTLTDDLTFTNGSLTTTWKNILIMDNAAADAAQDFVGYSSSKYIKGPVRIVDYAASGAYADTLEVPTGDGTRYAAIRIIPAGTGTNTWEARYADTAATSIGSNKCASNYTYISEHDRFWVNRTAGTTDAKIRFYWNADSEVYDQDEMNDLIILHWNSGSTCWEALSVDTTAYTRTWADQWIETEFDVTDYSPFAFGSIRGYQLLDPACQTVLTWDGSTSDSWKEATNWDLNTVPCGNDVIIPDVATDPILDSIGMVGNLTVNNGGFLTLAGAFEFNVNGNIDVNGTGNITQTGTNVVSMTGETKVIDVESTSDISTLELTIAGPISNNTNLDMEDLNVTTAGRFTLKASTTIELTDDLDNDGSITFSGTNDTIIIGDDLDNDGTMSLTTSSVLDVNGDIDVAAGKSIDLFNSTLYTAGDINNVGTMTFTGSTTEFDGTNTTTINDDNGLSFNNVIINKDDLADEIQFDDSIRFAGTLTFTQGTVKSDGTTNSFTVVGATTMNGGKFDHNDNGVYRFGDLTMNGTSNITTAGSDANDFIEIGGDVDLNGTATIVQTGDVDIRLIGAGKTLAVEAGVTTSTVELDVRTTADYDCSDHISLEDLTMTDAGDFAMATTKILTLSDDLTITNSNGVFTLTGTASANVAGDWTNNSGTFNENSSTVTFSGTENSTIENAAGETFYNLVTNKTAIGDSVEFDDGITVSNSYTHTQGVLMSDGTSNTFEVQGATVVDGGKITKNDNGIVDLQDLTMNNDAAIESSGSDANDYITIAGDVDLNGTAIISSTGDVDVRLSGANKTITAEAGVTTSTVELNVLSSADYDCSDDFSLEDLTITDAGDFDMATAKTLTLSDDLTITTSNGIFTLTGTAAATIAGDWSNAGGTFNENSSTVTFNGTENSSLGNTSGSETFNHLIVSKSATADTVATDDSIQVAGNFTNTEGTYHINTGTLDVSSTLNIDGGEIWLPSGTLRADEATVDMDGGVLDIDGGTVDFDNDASGNVEFDISAGKVELATGTINVGDDVLLSGGEIEVVSGTLNVKNEEGTTNKGLAMSGGNVDLQGGTIDIANEYVQTGGTLDMAGGTLAVGSTSDALLRIALGTYNMTGGTIDIQSSNASANEVQIGVGATKGLVTGTSLKMSATDGGTEIDVDKSMSIYTLEVAATGQTVTLIDSLEVLDSLLISSGTLSAGAFDIQMRGNWVNNATDGVTAFNGGTGAVLFQGSSKQYVRGSKTVEFADLVIDNSSNVKLDTTTVVSDVLTLTTGLLETHWSDMLVMDNGADDNVMNIQGANASRYIAGPMAVNGFAATGAYADTIKAPVGDGAHYSPVYIIPSGAGVNDWEVRYADSSVATISTSRCDADFENPSVSDLFHVRRTSGTETAKLRFYWNANSGITASKYINDLVLVHYDKPNGACWESMNTDTAMYTRNWSEKWIETEWAVDEYSPFAFAAREGLMLLPIELIEFTAVLNKVDDVVDLNWATASEVNTSHFTIERRDDQNDFESIASVPAIGHSVIRNDYGLVDFEPLQGNSYYRLKQVDENGEFTYSDVRLVVNNNELEQYDLEVISNQLVLKSYSGEEVNYSLRIVDVLGRIVMSQEATTNNYISLSHFQLGVYFINIEVGEETIMKKIVFGQ